MHKTCTKYAKKLQKACTLEDQALKAESEKSCKEGRENFLSETTICAEQVGQRPMEDRDVWDTVQHGVGIQSTMTVFEGGDT